MPEMPSDVILATSSEQMLEDQFVAQSSAKVTLGQP
jgi:hypothetical protein